MYMMIAYILFFYFPSIIESIETNRASSLGPEIKRLNDTFILVNYQDILASIDFSLIRRVKFYQQTPEYKLLAEASINYEGEPIIQTGEILVQPLEEGQDLLTKIDPCTNYYDLYLEFEHVEEKFITSTFKLSPSMFISEINRWLCYEDDNSVHLSLDSPENTFLRPCADRVFLSTKVGFIELSNGVNQDIKITDYRLSMIRYAKDGIVKRVETNEELITCSEQRKRNILQNTEEWICMKENDKVDYFKQQWEEFEIKELNYRKKKLTLQTLKFGLNDIEDASYSFFVVTLMIRFEDDYQIESNYKLVQCSQEESKDGLLWILIIVLIFVAVLAVVVAVVIYCVKKNRRVAENLEMSPRAGPQQDEDTDYDPYDNAEEIYRIYSDDGGTYWAFSSGNEMRQFENAQNSQNI